MFFLALLGCSPASVDTGEPPAPSACDCADPTTLPFAATVVGGFDDWAGNAVVWAIDPAEGYVLVVAMAYTLGVPTQALTPDCTDPDGLVGSWFVATPPSGEGDVRDYPLLSTVITNAAGVRSLPQPLGALLLKGDVYHSEAEAIYVATEGGLSLIRGDGGQDRLLGALTFAATATAVGGDAVVDCPPAIRLAGLDLGVTVSGGE